MRCGFAAWNLSLIYNRYKILSKENFFTHNKILFKNLPLHDEMISFLLTRGSYICNAFHAHRNLINQFTNFFFLLLGIFAIIHHI